MLRILVTSLLLAETALLVHLLRDVPSQGEPEECPIESSVLPPAYSQHCNFHPPSGFDQMVQDAAKEFGIDPRLLATTVYRESGCNASALGASGDVGLTQIVPKVWGRALKNAGIIHATGDLWEPRTNLRAGAWILAQLSEDAEGSLWGIFRRYNGVGPRAKKYAHEQVQAFFHLWPESV